MPVLLRGPMLRGGFSQNTPLIPPKSISLREIAGGAGLRPSPLRPPFTPNLWLGVNVVGAFRVLPGFEGAEPLSRSGGPKARASTLRANL